MAAMAEVIYLKPQRKPVAEACRWSEAFEVATARNLHVAFAWQRMALRFFWGV